MLVPGGGALHVLSWHCPPGDDPASPCCRVVSMSRTPFRLERAPMGGENLVPAEIPVLDELGALQGVRTLVQASGDEPLSRTFRDRHMHGVYAGWMIHRHHPTVRMRIGCMEGDVDDSPRIRDRVRETSLALIDLMMTGRGMARIVLVSFSLLVVFVACLEAGQQHR